MVNAPVPQNRIKSRRTNVKHNPQLLFRLHKFLLPRLPQGGVLHEIALAIVTADEVDG